MVWQYSGRRVLGMLHQHQTMQPSGMYSLHMNGVHPNPNLGPGGPGAMGPPAPPQQQQMMQGNHGAALSPARTGTTIDDERFSPGPSQSGNLPAVGAGAAGGVPPGVLPFQPGGPGPAMGPGGFAYRGPQVRLGRFLWGGSADEVGRCSIWDSRACLRSIRGTGACLWGIR